MCLSKKTYQISKQKRAKRLIEVNLFCLTYDQFSVVKWCMFSNWRFLSNPVLKWTQLNIFESLVKTTIMNLTSWLDFGILKTEEFSWEREHSFWHWSSRSLSMTRFTAYHISGHFIIISAKRSGVEVVCNISIWFWLEALNPAPLISTGPHHSLPGK